MSEYYIPIGDGLRQQFYRQGFEIDPTVRERAKAMEVPESEDYVVVGQRPVLLSGKGPWALPMRWLGAATKHFPVLNANHQHFWGKDGRNIGYGKPSGAFEDDPSLLPWYSYDTPNVGNTKMYAPYIWEAGL